MSIICMSCLDAEAEWDHNMYVSRRGDSEDIVFSWREPVCTACLQERFQAAIDSGKMRMPDE